MKRREFVQRSLLAAIGISTPGTNGMSLSNAGTSLLRSGSTPAPGVAGGTLFPIDVPEHKWSEFPAAGFSGKVSGVVYRTAALHPPECGMPLGGIGTGCIDIGMDGRLGFCTLFNRVWGWDYRDRVYALSDASLKLQNKGGGAEGETASPLKGGIVRDLPSNGRGPLNLPFLGISVNDNAWILATGPMHGVNSAKRIHYWGHYPVADIEYELDSPVSVGVRAWCPFLPGDIENSQIPGAVFEVNVRNLKRSNQEITLALSFPGPEVAEESPNLTRSEQGEGRFRGAVLQSPDTGYVLGAIDEKKIRLGGELGNNRKAWARMRSTLPPVAKDDSGASAAVDFVLKPGEQRVVRFVLAWHTREWQSEFPYGLKLSKYTNHYTETFPSALDAARKIAENHETLLRRILAWQQVVYSEDDLPIWLRDQLVNILHLVTEESFWAVAKPPLGDWCYQGGLFSLVESTVAAGQQSCIPCDWYGNLPIVYFFPDLAWSTLRGYRVKMSPEGRVPFYLGQGLDMVGGPNETNYAYERQQSLNGPCYADLVDRLWLVTGNDEVLHEFYPSVKKNVFHTMGENPDSREIVGVITDAAGEWYESMDMRGITAHAGGVRLAQLQIAQRMAEKMGDSVFAGQCRQWLESGSRTLEEELWDGENYLLSLDPSSGKKSDLVLAYQLDGEWIAHLHGVHGVFRPDRVDRTLAKIKSLNSWVPLNGVIDVIQRDGRPTTFGDRMGWMGSMPASVFILAMTYLYAGHRNEGLGIAQKCMDALVNRFQMTWDMPNVVRSDPGDGQLQESMRIYGTDYYQCMSLWAFPAALRGQDLRGPSAPGGLVARVIEAAGGV